MDTENNIKQFTVGASITLNIKAFTVEEARSNVEYLLQTSLYQTNFGDIKLGYHITNISDVEDITIEEKENI